MIKLLHFTGPGSFAAFLAAAGEGVLPAVRFVREFENGGVACFLDMGSLDKESCASVLTAVRTAHAVEPVKVDHDVDMSSDTLAFLVDQLANRG